MQKLRALFAYVRHRASSDYQQSIVRRTAILCGLVVPGFAANFLVYFFSAQLLPADQFGLFYVALTIGNVLYSGANILNVFLTRHLVRVGEAHGAGAIIPTTLRLERNIAVTGAACSAAVFLALVLAAKQIGVQSPIIIVLVVLDTYTAYVTDLGRVLLQSLRRTFWLGIYTIAWMFLRLGLCLAGILMFGTVWGALAGIVLSALVVFAVFHLIILPGARGVPHPEDIELSLLPLVPAAAGYGLLVLVSNLDVLFSYFLLSEADLGVYSASSVFPKAALVVITPLLQMLIPMMIAGGPSKRYLGSVMLRIGGAILALTAAGSIMVWLVSDWVCGSRYGLKLCQPQLLAVLLLSVVPLSLLRTQVVLEFAWGRDLVALWLAVPALAYVPFVWLFPPNMVGLASGFAAFSAAAFVFFVISGFAAERLRARA